VAGGWGTQHNEELCNLHTSPDIVQVIKSRRMRYSTYKGDEKCIQNFSQKT